MKKDNKFFIYISFFLSCFACTNPFATRDAEAPEVQDRLTIPTRPLAYADVIPFFEKAISEKNIANYMNCFIDDSFPIQSADYTFSYDKRIAQDSFTGWSLQDEQNYFNNIVNDSENGSPELQLKFLEDQFTYIPLANSLNDSVQVMPFSYELSIIYRDSIAVYQGIGSMKLIANSNSQWAIYYWEDRQNDDGSAPSWSFLKAERRNR